MKIIKAVDYGSRTVLWVCRDATVPEWVHHHGSVLLDGAGVPALDEFGLPRLVGPAPADHVFDGTTCHNCRYNWDVTEVIFEGSDLYITRADGELLRLSDDELGAAAFARVAESSTPRGMDALVGRSD